MSNWACELRFVKTIREFTARGTPRKVRNEKQYSGVVSVEIVELRALSGLPGTPSTKWQFWATETDETLSSGSTMKGDIQ